MSEFKNFEQILPQDKVENFTYSEDECAFNIKGITPMKIKRDIQFPYKQIVFKSEGLAKFNFTLMAFFNGDDSLPGECKIELSGDMNPFILSMAEKSLKSLVDTMSLKLSQLNLIADEN